MHTYLKKEQWELYKQMIPKKTYKEVLPILQKSIRRVLESDDFRIEEITLEMQAMYGVSLSGKKNGRRLHVTLKEEITNHLEQKVRRDILKSFDSDNFLDILYACYKKNDYSMVLIREMLYYVDSLKVDSIWNDKLYNMGRELFLNLIIRFIRSHLRSTLLSKVNIFRDIDITSSAEMYSEQFRKSSVENICQMLINLDYDGYIKIHMTYEEVFQTPLIKMFTIAAKIFSEKLLAQKCVSKYIRKAESVLINESERAKMYIESTKKQLIESIEEELIQKKMHELVEMDSGVVFMITNDKIDDLAYMYCLLKRVPDGLNILFACVSQHLRTLGRSLVEKEEGNDTNVVDYLKKLLDLKDKFYSFLTDSFYNDQMFQTIIYADIDYIFNLNDNLYRAISRFFSNNMERPMSHDNFEIDKLLLYLSALYEERENQFDEFYFNYLKKKFTLNRIHAVTYENEIIPQLRPNFNVDFMTKLENIVNNTLTTTEMEVEKNITDNVDISLHENSNI
ncbi:cullin-3-B-like [Adelges cooleyi]|uniref:cullin-3-B-like n=1 Tax=Adelges cooleyi TaxID=133065 RepID=UPI00217FA335|nr:cullin-3-B-like [Adelges cooleyi]